MRMTASEKVFAPELYRYLRDSMPDCANVSSIVNNLVKYGGFRTVPDARHALHWGTDPVVFTSVPSNLRCSNASGHAKCAFDPTQSWFIVVNVEEFNEFIAGRGTGFTSSGRPVPIMGVALLHALCHWGNFQAGISETAEQGHAFERATYGRTIG